MFKRKKRFIRRKPRGIARGLSPAIMNFKRSRYEIVSIGVPSAGWLMTSDSKIMYKTFDFRLSDLNDNSDFVNLFKYYKINAVRTKIWACNTVTGENNYTGQFPNSQLLVRYDINQDGNTQNADNQNHYLDSQTAKARRLISGSGRPLDLLMRLKQSNMIYKQLSAGSSTAYNLMRPKWVSTVEDDAAHYGLNMAIHRMSDDVLSNGFVNNQKLRIEYTYYLSCKKVE